MASFNQVIVMGNLTRDPELKYLDSGSAVCEFSVAVNRRWKSGNDVKEEVSFFDCVAWGRTGEVIAEHLKKGRPAFLLGRLQQDRWDDKQTGAKRSRIRIVVERMQFIGGREVAGSIVDQPTPPVDDTFSPPPESDDPF